MENHQPMRVTRGPGRNMWQQHGKPTTDINGKHPEEAGFDMNNIAVWKKFLMPRYLTLLPA